VSDSVLLEEIMTNRLTVKNSAVNKCRMKCLLQITCALTEAGILDSFQKIVFLQLFCLDDIRIIIIFDPFS